jgi:hypothetical protein
LRELALIVECATPEDLRDTVHDSLTGLHSDLGHRQAFTIIAARGPATHAPLSIRDAGHGEGLPAPWLKPMPFKAALSKLAGAPANSSVN